MEAAVATQADEELHCPLCDYNLRGLADPRCPECGYAFQWADLRDPAKRLHPYLFEHHPEHNVWSFTRTLLGALEPRRFWARLLPTQPSSARRLLLYALLTSAPLLVALLAWNGHRALEWAAEVRFRRGWTNRFAGDPGWKAGIVRQYGSVAAYDDAVNPLPPTWRFFVVGARDLEFRPFDKITLGWLAWPWLTFLSLLLFRFSMRRARVRPAHVLRCVVYSFDAFLWLGLFTAAVVAEQWYTGQLVAKVGSLRVDELSLRSQFYADNAATAAVCWGGLVLLPFMAWRLTVAYRKYLGFDRPAATVLASQVIVLLTVLVLIMNMRML